MKSKLKNHDLRRRLYGGQGHNSQQSRKYIYLRYVGIAMHVCYFVEKA